ncbi:MAG: hypothetical protein QOF96_3476 [Actinomycetota bacterium]|jgi:hypothetical protein|nr:hypothetical protein [Actinomycetota bacterium]
MVFDLLYLWRASSPSGSTALGFVEPRLVGEVDFSEWTHTGS